MLVESSFPSSAIHRLRHLYTCFMCGTIHQASFLCVKHMCNTSISVWALPVHPPRLPWYHVVRAITYAECFAQFSEFFPCQLIYLCWQYWTSSMCAIYDMSRRNTHSMAMHGSEGTVGVGSVCIERTYSASRHGMAQINKASQFNLKQAISVRIPYDGAMHTRCGTRYYMDLWIQEW